MNMVQIDIRNHVLVPKHVVLSDEEAKKVLEQLGVRKEQLPRILITDPVIRLINAKVGDVIKIIRDSPTAGTEIAYRVVVESL